MSSRALAVIDASVVVKWYIPEQDHRAARALRDDYLNGALDLLAPACLPFEVINALRYSELFSEDDLTAAARTLPKYGITIVPFREIKTVVECSQTLDSPIYDASYLALAADYGTTMQTADERLLRKAENTEYADHVTHIQTYSTDS